MTEARRRTAATEAGQALAQSLRLDPGYGKAYANLGNVYTFFDDPQAAAQALQAAARSTPDDWRAQFFLGQALATLGEETEARAAWHRSAGVSAYFVKQADDLRAPDPEGSQLSAERAVAADPASPGGYLALGKTLSAQKAYTDALEIYQTAVAQVTDTSDPGLAACYYEMGTLLHRQFGEAAEATSALVRAAALQPKDEATLLELATISQERGACYEAETWLAPLLETPSSPAKGAQASALVGRCFLAQERPETAVPYFERAVRDDATSVSTWLLLGQANRAAGHVDAAIDAYEQVLVLKPDNATAQKALDELQGIAREPQVRCIRFTGSGSDLGTIETDTTEPAVGANGRS